MENQKKNFTRIKPTDKPIFNKTHIMFHLTDDRPKTDCIEKLTQLFIMCPNLKGIYWCKVPHMLLNF